MPDVALCSLDRLQQRRGWPVSVGSLRLAVFLVGHEVRVVRNECTHQAAPVDGGAVEGRVLVCPWHGWSYDIDTGELQTELGSLPGLRRYEAWVAEGVVYARVPDSDIGMGD